MRENGLRPAAKERNLKALIPTEKCERLESDIAIVVSGRNQEIYELNKTIVSLKNKLKAAEINNESINQLNDQLSNMQNSIVALEAKLDNPLPKKLTTNENSPENNESKTASPPTQPPLNQLNNVEIPIVKPLALGLDEILKIQINFALIYKAIKI